MAGAEVKNEWVTELIWVPLGILGVMLLLVIAIPPLVYAMDRFGQLAAPLFNSIEGWWRYWGAAR